MLRERPLLFIVLVVILSCYFIHIGIWTENHLPAVRDVLERLFDPSRWFTPPPP